MNEKAAKKNTSAAAAAGRPKESPPAARSIKELQQYGEPDNMQNSLNTLLRGKKTLAQRHKKQMREQNERTTKNVFSCFCCIVFPN